jgi:CRISPR/Cas system-associated protein Cas5 (RAMP superfamily)
VRELRETLMYVGPILGSMLSVVAVFIAVYFSLTTSSSYSPLFCGMCALVGAIITAVAEIGLFLINYYHKIKHEQREAKKKKRIEEKKKEVKKAVIATTKEALKDEKNKQE